MLTVRVFLLMRIFKSLWGQLQKRLLWGSKYGVSLILWSPFTSLELILIGSLNALPIAVPHDPTPAKSSVIYFKLFVILIELYFDLRTHNLVVYANEFHNLVAKFIFFFSQPSCEFFFFYNLVAKFIFFLTT